MLGLKEGQSVKIIYHFRSDLIGDRDPKEFKGIVYKEDGKAVHLIADRKVQSFPEQNTYTTHYVSLPKEFITNVSNTRFPKELSSKLKVLLKMEKETEETRRKIYELERKLRNQCVDIEDFEKEIIETRLTVSPTLRDFANKLASDIKSLSDSSHHNGETFYFDIHNPQVSGNLISLQMDLSKVTRNVRGVHLNGDHMHNVDMNDWERVAEQQVRSFKLYVDKYFSFAKKIDNHKSASPGEKMYCQLDDSYIIYLNINGKNYTDILQKVKLAADELKRMFL